MGASPSIIKWAKIFKAKTLAELEKLAGQEEVFKKMVVELKKLSNDEKIRQQMAARADYESRIATARGAGIREGIEKGREDGIKESRKETILNMLEDNLPIEKIVLYTGCTVSNIEDIRNGKFWSSIYEINRSPIDWCIANNVLKEFLENRKKGVRPRGLSTLLNMVKISWIKRS